MTETNTANGVNMRQLIDADLQDTLDEEIEIIWTHPHHRIRKRSQSSS